ncbi:MAG: bifunctional oligoribonuclease/PAP phosphatase NrnA [Elusimicrobiota bacterium]
MKNVVRLVLEKIRSSRTFVITAHAKPDGDTIGSELALSSWLKRMGKKVCVYSKEKVPNGYDFLNAKKVIHQTNAVVKGKFDIGFFLECSSVERSGGILDLASVGTSINIDHHIFNGIYGDINWVDSDAAASAVQIYELIRSRGNGVTLYESKCLYTGIVTDTGRFQQSNATWQALRIASDLVKAGVCPNEIFRNVYATKKVNTLKLLSLALATMKIVSNGKVVYQHVDRGMLKTTGTSLEDTEEFVDYGLLIPGIEVSMLFYDTEVPNHTKVSFRSFGEINVNKIARKFGGGGHLRASGCTIIGGIEKAKRVILSELKAYS